jgi:hypothetical protein
MPSNPPDAALFRDRLDSALQRLSDRDFHLLSADVNERSITHKLAEYLQAELPDWHVDCEYNRDRHDSKLLELPHRSNVSSEDVHARTVFPDIIVHHRNTQENLLVIEVKKSSSTEDESWDWKKIDGVPAAAWIRSRRVHLLSSRDGNPCSTVCTMDDKRFT